MEARVVGVVVWGLYVEDSVRYWNRASGYSIRNVRLRLLTKMLMILRLLQYNTLLQSTFCLHCTLVYLDPTPLVQIYLAP